MPSKMVTDRQKSAESVRAALNTHSGAMARGVAETLGDPALVPSVEKIVATSAARLATVTGAMVQADDQNLRERGEDVTAREAFDARVGELRADLVGLRGAVASVLGEGAVRTLGFAGNTPEDGVALERLALTVVENLGKLAAPTYAVPGFSFDPAPWKSRLQAHVGPVGKARAALAAEVRESEATQTAKDKTVAEYDRTFSRIATLASAMLEIAGESELARRVRPSSRRPGRTVADGDVDPVPVP